MIPGEYLIIDGSLEINSESNTITIEIINEGDRPIQVGSHFHFAEVNAFLKFAAEVSIVLLSASETMAPCSLRFFSVEC